MLRTTGINWDLERKRPYLSELASSWERKTGLDWDAERQRERRRRRRN